MPMVPQHADYNGAVVAVANASQEEEGVLLHRLTQGDAAAFWELWQQYRTTLAPRCLQWMGGNYDEAEDALSSASVKAWQYLSAHAHEIANLRAWLTQLLYHHCMDLRRGHQTRFRCGPSVAYAQDEVSSRCGQVSLEDTMLLREMRTYVRRSIHTLPPRLREPLILYYFHGMSHRNIATYLYLSPANVRKRLQHARTLMHAQITPYLVEGEAMGAESMSENPAMAGFDVEQAVVSRPAQGHEAITSPVVAMRLVRITLPDRIERHVLLALAHKPVRQQQKVETLRTYVQRHPSGWRKRVQLADLLYTMGHWEEAIVAYRRVLHCQAHRLEVRLRLGHMLQVLQRQDEALAVYEGALAFARRTATRHYVEGCMAVCRQHLATAVQSWTAAAALEPRNVVHWRALGLLHSQADRPVEALHAFETALAIDADDLVALTYSYDPLMAMGRYEEAQRRMQRALHIDPGHVLALTRLADSHCRRRWVQGEVGMRTRTLIRRAMQMAPESPAVQEVRARYHIVRGEWDAGLALLRQYTAEHPYCPEGWSQYARWCFHTGADQSAAEAILQAHALDPHDAAIYKAACAILPAAGRQKDGQRLIEEMLQRFPDRWSVWTTAGSTLVDRFQDQGYACAVPARAT